MSHKIILKKRSIIETVNDELKNIYQIEHPRYRSFENFIKPTTIKGLTTELRCFKEEIFGPVAAMMKFSTNEEAI